MTVEEATAALADRPCDYCGASVEIRSMNPNHLYIHCPTCNQKYAWTGVQYLKQSNKKRRDPSPKDTDQIWEEGGQRCHICQATRPFLELLHIGRHAHHAWGYEDTEHEGPQWPICGACHELVTAQQKLVRKFRHRLAEVYPEKTGVL